MKNNKNSGRNLTVFYVSILNLVYSKTVNKSSGEEEWKIN